MKKWEYNEEFEEWTNEEYTIQRIQKHEKKRGREKFRLVHNDDTIGIYNDLSEAKVEAKRHKEGV